MAYDPAAGQPKVVPFSGTKGGQGYVNLPGAQPTANTSQRSPFASLLAGSVSGIGEGMMHGPFRAAYNAGQGGVFAPFQMAHLGKSIQQDAEGKMLNQQKLQNDFDEFDRMQAMQANAPGHNAQNPGQPNSMPTVQSSPAVPMKRPVGNANGY